MSENTPPRAIDSMRAALDRATNREGIPMVVALVDERGKRIPEAADSAVREVGASIAARIRQVHSELAPSMREGDNGAVITALVVAAHELIETGVRHG